MNGERSDGLGRVLRAVTLRRIGFTLLGLGFFGFWGLLFGSIAPLALVAALYLAMGASTPDLAPSSGSSSGSG
jgi:hypothetical protein